MLHARVLAQPLQAVPPIKAERAEHHKTADEIFPRAARTLTSAITSARYTVEALREGGGSMTNGI